MDVIQQCDRRVTDSFVPFITEHLVPAGGEDVYSFLLGPQAWHGTRFRESCSPSMAAAVQELEHYMHSYSWAKQIIDTEEEKPIWQDTTIQKAKITRSAAENGSLALSIFVNILISLVWVL